MDVSNCDRSIKVFFCKSPFNILLLSSIISSLYDDFICVSPMISIALNSMK